MCKSNKITERSGSAADAPQKNVDFYENEIMMNMNIRRVSLLGATFVGSLSTPVHQDKAVTVPIEIVQGVILVPATVHGHQGMFALDTGMPLMILNRAHLAPDSSGGLDTVAVPVDFARDSALYIANGHVATTNDWSADTLTIRIGTLDIPVDAAAASAAVRNLPSMATLAWLGYQEERLLHHPILGVIGLPALGGFETIIDLAHRQLTLIPVDSLGRRATAAPDYTHAWSIPMLYEAAGHYTAHWYVEARIGGLLDTLELDTGNDRNELNETTRTRIQSHVSPTGQSRLQDFVMEPEVTLDSVVLAEQHLTKVPFFVARAAGREDTFGMAFFSRFKAVGFNFRAQQLMLYQ